MGMSVSEYKKLPESFTWICSICSMPNFTDSFFNETDSIVSENSFSSLSDLSTQEEPPIKAAQYTNTHRNNNISIMNINVQGIKGMDKRAELKVLIDDVQPDIVFGTESWLDPDYTDAEVFPQGYIPLRNDRNRNGGGVFILYKDRLTVTQEHTQTEEFILAKLQANKDPAVYLGVLYRPPDASEQPLDNLDTNLEGLIRNNKLPNLILAGD